MQHFLFLADHFDDSLSDSVSFLLGNFPIMTLDLVGYLSKKNGMFVTLFNAFHPEKSVNMSVSSLPSLYVYVTSSQREKRKSAQAVWGVFTNVLSNSGKNDGSYIHSFPVTFFGGNVAHLHADWAPLPGSHCRIMAAQR